MSDIEGVLVLSIPIVGIIMVMFGIYLDYKKHMAMIEKGLLPEDEKISKSEDKLGWGIAMLGIGFSLIISRILNFGIIITLGLIFISIGIPILVSYLIKKN